jgi:predicted signal transduction protein with EAL and GGDEF domain
MRARSSLTAEDLLSCADVAMYRAKRFRTGVELDGSVGAAREHGRIGLLGALAEAINKDQLCLAYQPQVRTAAGSATRSRHYCAGNIPPSAGSRPGSSSPLRSTPT